MAGSPPGVLVLTTALPARRRSGGEIVSEAIVEALRRGGFEPVVIGWRRPGDDGAAGPGERPAGSRPIETDAAGVRAAAWMAKAAILRVPYSVAKYWSRSYVRAVERALQEEPAAIVVDHGQVGFTLRRLGEAPLVYVAHNAESRAYGELAAFANRRAARWVYRRESRLIEAIERDLVRRAEQIWSLSADDRDELLALDSHADIRVLEVPAGIDRASVAAQDARFGVALIGNWTWRPNARGLEWFVSEVVPRLDAGISIGVAGAGADWLRGHERNIEVLGRVPDAAAFLGESRAVAVPAVAGSGVQVKTLDAIASGLPVVATSRAARGLGALPQSVAVADGAETFAEQLNRAVRGGVEANPRDEALSWSRARRKRFDDAVVEGIRSAIESHRSSPRAITEGATTR